MLQALTKSVYSPSFYAKVPQALFRKAIGHFLLLVFAMTLIKTAVFAVTVFTGLMPTLVTYLISADQLNSGFGTAS